MFVASQILSFLSEKISDSSSTIYSILYCLIYKTITKQGIGGQKAKQPSARMN